MKKEHAQMQYRRLDKCISAAVLQNHDRPDPARKDRKARPHAFVGPGKMHSRSPWSSMPIALPVFRASVYRSKPNRNRLVLSRYHMHPGACQIHSSSPDKCIWQRFPIVL